MLPKLIISFDRLGDPLFITQGELIVTCLTDNPNFPVPWPAPAPSLAELAAALEEYKTAYQDALSGDSQKIALRVSTRKSFTDMLKQLAAYLEFVAHGNVTALATTGFDLRHEIVRGGSDVLAAPGDFRAAHGKFSGTLELHAAKLVGANSYEVQSAQGDPSVEGNWKHTLTVATSSHIHLEGLVPAQTYWLRIRGISGHGFGQWSTPISIIVV